MNEHVLYHLIEVPQLKHDLIDEILRELTLDDERGGTRRRTRRGTRRGTREGVAQSH